MRRSTPQRSSGSAPRRRWATAVLAATSAATAVLLVPGVLYASTVDRAALRTGSKANGRAPTLELSVTPQPVRVRQPVRLALSAIGRPGATYRWVVSSGDGPASFATARPYTKWRFGRGGRFSVRVTRFDGRRAAGSATLQLTVRGNGEVRRPRATLKHEPARAAASVAAAAARPSPVHLAAAAAHSVTIQDFSFGPGSLTIQVGDTVTWTNNGPSQHTATAKDGSFNTGVLSKGQSASHTFTKAGTFSYICSIHTFMHGTIVVQGGGSASGGGSGSSGSGSSPSTSGGGSSGTSSPSHTGGSSLPMTGLDMLALIAAGAVLLAAGGALKRRTRAAFGVRR